VGGGVRQADLHPDLVILGERHGVDLVITDIGGSGVG
jgi:hypothetical protein